MRWLFPLVLLCGPHALGQESPVVVTLSDEVAAEPSLAPSAEFLDSYRAKAVEKWEKAISELEKRNASEENPAHSILFIGSSSIRRWDSIAVDMAPYPTIQRGYGGAKYSDLAVFAERLIRPHQYRALVSFVGNDVSGNPEDHTPDEVERLVRYVVEVSHQHQPEAPVFLIEVTPTEKRFKVWPQIREVNARLREIALSTPNTYFIATAGHFLDPTGHPRSEMFVDDRLHLNRDGYRLWSELIRRRLDEVFRATSEFHARKAAVE